MVPLQLYQIKIKLFKNLESCFKRTINWNRYLSKTANQTQNRYVDFLIDSSFQGAETFLFCHLKIMIVEKVTSNIFFES